MNVTKKMIRIIGIDCATKDAKIGVVSADYYEKSCCVSEFESKHTKAIEKIKDLVTNLETVLLCLDAPLGWPVQLSSSLMNHQAGGLLITPANKMFRRITDEVIREKYKKQPLDVGADRIARTAHSALSLLGTLRQDLNQSIHLAWEPNLPPGIWAIEVYPAATAKAHQINLKGYKDKMKFSARIAELLQTIATKLQFPHDQKYLATTDHVFDALLCVLAGFDFLTGKAMPPSEKQKEFAIKEGWIWVCAPSEALAAK